MAKTPSSGIRFKKKPIKEISIKSLREAAPSLEGLEKSISEYGEDELRSILSERGITLLQKGKKDAKLLVISCCSSFFDYSEIAACINYPDEVILGAKILMKISGVQKCVFAMPKTQLNAPQKIQERLPAKNSLIKIKLVNEIYPVRPQLTVYSLTSLEINAKKSAEDAGYPLYSARTCLNVYRALAEGFICDSELVGIFENEAEAVMRISFGEPLYSALGVQSGSILLRGDNIVSTPLPSDAVMTPDIKSLIIAKEENGLSFSNNDCIGCGKCVDICPAKIMPYKYLLAHDKSKLSPNLISDLGGCFECGCCTYICPCRIDVFEKIKALKYDSEHTEAIPAKEEKAPKKRTRVEKKKHKLKPEKQDTGLNETEWEASADLNTIFAEGKEGEGKDE